MLIFVAVQPFSVFTYFLCSYAECVAVQPFSVFAYVLMLCLICIGNRTISSTIWKLIDTNNVLKVLVIARADRRVQFKNFQNITSVY